MNILVIGDNFTKGGVETQIQTYWKYLKDDHNLWFCFANYENNGLIDDKVVHKDFHFSYEATISELIEDVDRLETVINDHHIDVIHVHPWFALYAAYFAAMRTSVKVVYSYHGISSLNYNNNIQDQILLEEILTSTVSHTFCVGIQGMDSLMSMNYRRTSLLVNPICAEEYQETLIPIGERKKWALVSRLDKDKIPAIERFINMLADLNIDSVDVYGTGDCEAHIRTISMTCGKEVRFMGHVNNLPNVLSQGGYSGVVGLGRCAIEGLALGLPVLFIGYGKVIGIIDRLTYERAKELNFIPESFRELSKEQINQQLELVYSNDNSFKMREQVMTDFDVSRIASDYTEILSSVNPMCPGYVSDIYVSLVNMNNLENHRLHGDNEVYDIIFNIVASKTRNMNVKNKILLYRFWNNNEKAERALNLAETNAYRLNTITLKRLTIAHFAARKTWIKNVLRTKHVSHKEGDNLGMDYNSCDLHR